MQELEAKVDELEGQLNTAQKSVSELTQAAQAQKLLDRANLELDQLRNRLRVSEKTTRSRLF